MLFFPQQQKEEGENKGKEKFGKERKNVKEGGQEEGKRKEEGGKKDILTF